MAHAMDHTRVMRDIDLNLLRLLDALMEERSVTKVSQRLGITQSAVSHSLKRLREVLDDPLFVRGATGLKPTARMNAVAPLLRNALNQLRDAISIPGFEPATTERLFTVAAVSYACSTLIPEVITALVARAPRARMRVISLPPDLSDALATGAVDLAIGVFQDVPPRFSTQRLFADGSVWVVGRTHPYAGTAPDFDALLAMPQMQVNAAADAGGVRGRVVSGGIRQTVFVDYNEHFLDPALDSPNTAISVPDVRTALATVSRSGLAVLVPRRLAIEAAEYWNLAILEPPRRSDTIDVSQMWHRDTGNEPGRRWLRELVAGIGLQ